MEVLGGDAGKVEAVNAVDQRQEEKRRNRCRRAFIVDRSRLRFHYDGGETVLIFFIYLETERERFGGVL